MLISSVLLLLSFCVCVCLFTSFERGLLYAGCAWEAADLRKKSWDDLHKLWYVLLKERNLLQSEKLAYARQRQIMPDSSRLTKVKKSMNRIKQVMSERARLEHDDEQIKAYLKAFIDAM